MIRMFALSAVLLAYFNAAIAAESSSILSAKGRITLTAEQAPSLFKKCWCGEQKQAEPLWLPTAGEVATMEAQLEKYIGTLNRTSGLPRIGPLYRGQYVGFVRRNVKHIYATYVPEDMAGHYTDGRAVALCDGGSIFWGIVYNTATGQFSELSAKGNC